jgi:Ca-activated chloride channel family protein
MGLLAGSAWADGMIVPVRPEFRVRGAWSVKYHHVNINVRDQVASVSIDQEFVYDGPGRVEVVPMPGPRADIMPRPRPIPPPPVRWPDMIEVEYFFPVPPEAAIDSMTLMVDGKEFAAKLYKADEARRIYEDIVRAKKDPALLEYVGFGLLKTSAFPLQAGKPCRVAVTYKSVCRKDRDLVEVWYPLNTEKFSAKAIEDVRVKVDIKAGADILAVYSPSHDLDVRKDKDDPRHVEAVYQAKNTLPIADFQVYYKAADEKVGASLLTHQADLKKDGYFMLLVSPNPRSGRDKVVPKDVILVLDTSGSMTGDKVDQAKTAVRFVIKNLNGQDRFNVIPYSDTTEAFFDTPVEASPEKVAKAMDLVDRIEARGGTNIHDALQLAMKMADTRGKDGKGDRPVYVLFYTDGQPTVGKVNEKDILEDTRKANAGGARIFAFGVGYDVNVRLLDRLVGDNGGKSDYVKPKEAIEGKISSLYSKIKNPVMTDLKVQIKGVKIKDMYPRQVGDLFEGDQIVLAGRYDPEELAKTAKPHDGLYSTQLVITGRYEGAERAFEYPVTVAADTKDCRYQFVEKIWAVRRVGFLLDQIQLSGKSQELIDELVRLSRDYGIMTPYTSFLADERTELHRPMAVREHASGEMYALSVVTGGAGQAGAVGRQRLAENDKGFAPAARSSPADAGGMVAKSGSVYDGGAKVGWDNVKDYEDGKQDVVANLRQVGQQNLYRRGNVWIAADAADTDLEKDKDKVITIDRFSKEYFELVKANTVEQNRVLSSQQDKEELVLKVRGQLYRIR